MGATLGGAGLVAALLVRVLRLDHLPFPLCTFRAVTGLPCLSCGSTRCVGRLAHLDLAGALAIQPLATVAALAILCWGLVDLVLLARHRFLALQMTPREMRRAGLVALVVLFLNWAYLLAHVR